MPRRKREEDTTPQQEEVKIELPDYVEDMITKQLPESLREIIKVEGKKASEVLAIYALKGMRYEQFSDITGDQILKCLDLLDEVQTRFIFRWQDRAITEHLTSHIKALREAYGLVVTGALEEETILAKLSERISERIKKTIPAEELERVLQRLSASMPQTPGIDPLTKAVEKLLLGVVEELENKIIDYLKSSGLDETMARLIAESVIATLKQEST